MKKYYVGRVCISELPQGRIRIREHKIVPNIDTFEKSMEFLEAERINKINNELSEGDMAYIAINDHLVVIVEVLPDDDDF